MKVSVREARKNFSQLLNYVEAGEEITITRNGKEIAKLVSQAKTKKYLPDLTEFRNSIDLKGEDMSQTVIKMRKESRY